MKSILTCMLFIISLFSHAQSTEVDRLDSLNTIALEIRCDQVALSDSITSYVLGLSVANDYLLQQARAYCIQSRNQACRGEYRESVRLAKKGIEIFKTEEDVQGEARAISLICSAYRKLFEKDSAVVYMKKLLQLANRIGNEELLAKAYVEHASQFIEEHHHDSALFYSLKALEIAENGVEVNFLGSIYENLATSYTMNDMLQKGKQTFLQAKEFYEHDQYRTGLPNSIYINLGGCYVHLQQYDSAIIIYEEGLKQAERMQNGFMLSYLNRGIGSAYWRKGETEKAIRFATKAKEISEKHAMRGNLVIVLSELAKYYSSLNQFDKAIAVGVQGVEIARETKNDAEQVRILKDLATAYEKNGQPAKAVDLFKEIIELSKKLEAEAKNKEFAKLHTQFENRKKRG